MRYGLQAEAPLRELFKLDFPEYNFQYYENNLWTNDLFPWANASLDGWMYDKDGRFGVWECKTATVQTDTEYKKWLFGVPKVYFCQILHNMAVTSADFAVIKAQLKRPHPNGEFFHTVTLHYFYQREYNTAIMWSLMQQEKEFYKCLQDPAQGPPVWVKKPEETEAEA